MSAALNALLYPFEQGLVPPLTGDAKGIFFNALYHPALDSMDLDYVQPFKIYHDILEERGYSCAVLDADDGPDTAYDYALVLGTKNIVETRAYIAQAITVLKPGGLIVVAAENKGGGSRLKKVLGSLTPSPLSQESKFKARVVFGAVDSMENTAVEEAIQDGAVQDVPKIEYTSQPGVYGWNKIDHGSSLLGQLFDNEIAGCVADFGCGYGYLSDVLLGQSAALSELHIIDADARALHCAVENLENSDVLIIPHWLDLTHPVPDFKEKFDHIIMNPPFHEGQSADTSIGTSFIETAYHALKPGGCILMVANSHLPYEDILQRRFKHGNKLFEGDGFKIFEAFKKS